MTIDLSNLPPWSSVSDLNYYLADLLTGSRYSTYSLTVEELCEVIERYDEYIEVECEEWATHYTDNAVNVTIFGCSASDDSWQTYTGLYRFKSKDLEHEYREKFTDFARVLDELEIPSGCIPLFRNTNSGNHWDNEDRKPEHSIAVTSLRHKLVSRRDNL